MYSSLYRYILTIALTIVSISTIGQPWLYNTEKLKSTDIEYSFEEIQVAFNAYWESKEIERGKGYKQFKRWEQFIAPRIEGNTLVNSTAYWGALDSKVSIGVYDTLKWKYIGPGVTPNVINTTNKSGSGRLNCIAFHPSNENIIYVGAPSGGLWISENNGQTWTTTTDKLNAIGISDIAVTTTDTSTVIYLATGDGDAGDTYSIGILKSIDNGQTWEPTALSLNATNGIYFRRLIMHPSIPEIMFATSSKGVYKTEDSWQSYSLVLNGDFKDIEFSPNNSNTVYTANFNNNGNAQIYRSTDGGSTFAVTSSGLNFDGKVSRIELATTKNNPNSVYALCCSAVNGGFYALYRSTNNGDSWSLLYDDQRINLLGWSPSGTDVGGQGWYDLAMAVSPVNTNNIIVGGINNWRSTNGGTQWELSSWLYHYELYEYVHADQHMLIYSPHTNHLYSANDGGIYRSEDDGETWSDITNNLQILQSYKLGSSVTNPQKLICGNQDNGTFFKNSTNWSLVLGGDGMYCYISPSNEELLYGSAYNGAIYKSTNSGQDFVSIKPEGDVKGAWVTPFIMQPKNSSILFIAYKDIFKTADGGDNWTQISTELSDENLQSLAIAPSNDNYIYTATYKKLYKTTDGGVNWIEVPVGFSDLSITSICISPNDPNKIWLSLSGYNELDKVYYSANGGESWINYSNGLPNVPINEVVMRFNSRNELFAATDIGVYYINADTSHWVDYSITLPNTIISDIEIIEPLNILRVATYGRGVWETQLPEALPSKANFESNILSGCLDAPIQLYYIDTLSFDSLVWAYPDGQLIRSSLLNDTIEVKYSEQGRKTIQLKHYQSESMISEVKYEYLDIRDTLDISLSPSQYNVCDSSELKIELRKGYEYNWSPSNFLDTTKGSNIVVKPLNSILYNITANHGNCQTIIELPVLYMPDNVCNAVFLTTGSEKLFSNYCASIEPNEPIPPVGTGENDGCISQDGWCNEQTTLENSLWFKVIVPDNRRLRVKVSGFDSQIAMYKADNCEGLLSNQYSFIAANDDISSINQGSEIDIQEGLTSGDTIYIQLDGSFNGLTGEFEILVSDQPSDIETYKADLPFNLSVYPNPARELASVIIDNCEGESLILELISQTGSIVYSLQTTSHTPKFETTISTDKLDGLYILRVTSAKSTITKKLIVL